MASAILRGVVWNLDTNPTGREVNIFTADGAGKFEARLFKKKSTTTTNDIFYEILPKDSGGDSFKKFANDQIEFKLAGPGIFNGETLINRVIPSANDHVLINPFAPQAIGVDSHQETIYYITIVPPAAPANRGGKSLQRRSRKRNSRHVSKKRLSAIRRSGRRRAMTRRRS